MQQRAAGGGSLTREDAMTKGESLRDNPPTWYATVSKRVMMPRILPHPIPGSTWMNSFPASRFRSRGGSPAGSGLSNRLLGRNNQGLEKKASLSKLRTHLIGILEKEPFDPGPMSSQNVLFSIIDEDDVVTLHDSFGLHHDLEESSFRLAALQLRRDVKLVKDWKVSLVPGEPVCEMNRVGVGDSDDTDACGPQLLQEVENVLVDTKVNRIPARRHVRVGQIQVQAGSNVVEVALGGDSPSFKRFELVVNAEPLAKCRPVAARGRCPVLNRQVKGELDQHPA